MTLPANVLVPKEVAEILWLQSTRPDRDELARAVSSYVRDYRVGDQPLRDVQVPVTTGTSGREFLIHLVDPHLEYAIDDVKIAVSERSRKIASEILKGHRAAALAGIIEDLEWDQQSLPEGRLLVALHKVVFPRAQTIVEALLRGLAEKGHIRLV